MRTRLFVSFLASVYFLARANKTFDFHDAKILFDVRKPEDAVADFGHADVNDNVEFARFIGNLSVILRRVRSRTITVLVPMRYAIEKRARQITEQLVYKMPTVQLLLRRYNSSGVTSLLATTGETLRKKQAFLSKLSQADNTSAEIGACAQMGDAVFFSILKVCKDLDRNSAVLVFADRMPIDEDLAQLAHKEIASKNIKIFVLWSGLYPAPDNRQLLLQQTAIATLGAMFITPRNAALEHYEANFAPTIPQHTIHQAIIAFRTNLKGTHQFVVPVDSEVIGLHVTLPVDIKKAVLKPPHGSEIDLRSDEAVRRFSRDAIILRGDNTLEVQLNVNSIQAGPWRLVTSTRDGMREREDALREADDSNRVAYNVTISVVSAFHIVSKLVNDSTVIGRRILRLDILGNYQHLEQIQFVDRYGRAFHPLIKYQLHSHQKPLLEAQVAGVNNDVESISDANEIDIPIDNLPRDPIFVRINGTDRKGNEFVRMSYIDRVNLLNPLPPTTIDVGLQSELLVTPNRGATLYFEVNNNRDQINYMRFGCRDEQSLLVRMEPLAAYVSPGQTLVVSVQIYVRASASSDRVTFSAFSGTDRYTKSAEVRIVGQGGAATNTYDRDQPELWRTFNSDCLGVTVCHEKVWNVRISAKDTGVGLLQLTSSPKGLYFPVEFVAGTREEVSGYYSASCCESRIQAIAYDLNHNRRYIDIDAYWAPLTPGIIAAIVLGVILLFAIIIFVIVVVVVKRRNQRESFDLPTYQGPARSASTRRY